jgi:D-alanyl-D-alanine carboxypeptidase
MGGQASIGHSGGGLGAGCQLYYFSNNNTYFFIGINMGSITEGPITDAALPILDSIHKVIAN